MTSFWGIVITKAVDKLEGFWSTLTTPISSSAAIACEKKWKGSGVFESGNRILRLEGKKSFFKSIKVAVKMSVIDLFPVFT